VSKHIKKVEPSHSSVPKLRGTDRALNLLEHATKRLRLFGLTAFVLTVLSVCILLSMIGGGIFLVFRSLTFIVLTSSLVSTSALLCLIAYEYERKRGDVLFEEISDELQWYVRESDTESDSRPLIGARVVLRSFARSVDLPLAPGRFGPAVYFLVNAISIFLQLYYLRFWRPH